MGYITYDVTRRKKLARSNHRILLGMCVSDIISSICTVLGRLPAPPDVKYNAGLGNEALCSAQGFFYQTVLTTVAYNSGLAIYFLLVVRYDWKERQIIKVERWIHVFAIALFLVSASVLAGLKLFNPAYFICFIESMPRDCNDEKPCIRGIYPNTMRWIFFYGPVWVMILAVTGIMALVYSTVLSQEKRMDQFVFRRARSKKTFQKTVTRTLNRSVVGRAVTGQSPSERQHEAQSKKREMSRQVAVQGMWYLVPFYLTWIFPMLSHAFSSLDAERVNYRLLLYLTTIFLPLQGFMNWIVYLRPRIVKWWQRKGKQSFRDSAIYSSVTMNRFRSEELDQSHSVVGAGDGRRSIKVGRRSENGAGHDDDDDEEKERPVSNVNADEVA